MTETTLTGSNAARFPSPDPGEAFLAEVVFAESIAGQTVLTIGSGSGLILLCALEKGATKAAMVDANRLNIEVARAAGRLAGFSPEFNFGKWEDIFAGIGDFDNIVVSLRPPTVRDPITAIRQMMARARKRLIIEFDCPMWGDGLAYVLALLAKAQPLVWLPKPSKPGRVVHRPFLFTPAAIKHLFGYHSTLFEPIRISWPDGGGRFIVEAHRRRVRNLLVVAGPSSSGKSTFATRLADEPGLRKEFGLSGEWQHIRGRDVARLPAGDIENLIVELDLMAVERGDVGSFDDIPQFQILRAAENLKVLTMLPVHPPGNIRMSAKEISRLSEKCGALGEALAGFYRRQGDGELVRQLYAAWFDWAKQRGAGGMLLIVNDFADFLPLPIGEFDRAFDRALNRSS